MYELPPFPEPAPRPEPQYRGPSPKGGLVLAAAGVMATALLGGLVGARSGALALAVTLAIAGTWRAVAPRATHAAGIVVRSKTLDVFLYWGGAVAITVLALTVPYLS